MLNKLSYKGEYNATIIKHHHCCYRDETIENVYLSPEYDCLDAVVNNINGANITQRLYTLIQSILTCQTLIVHQHHDYEVLNLLNVIEYINYTKRDHISIQYEDVLTINYLNITNIILIWPSHYNINEMSKIYNHFNKLNNNIIQLHLIHSTIEESYVDRSIINESILLHI